MRLAGKTVLITGGRRIGAQLALKLAERGANLAFSYHSSADAMRAVMVDCQHMGVDADLFSADLRNPASAESLVEKTVTRFGSLDVLINLTSIYTRTPWDTLQPKDYNDAIANNLSAPYFTAIATAKAMLRQPVENGLQGKIIHFTDWAVDRPYPDYLPYLIAKGGLVTLTKALAVELAPTITVNAVAPGTVEPPKETSPEKLEKIRASSALNRVGSANDVNEAVLYLLEGTDFVTGEVFRVDGGRFLGSTVGGA
jgi:pteridine reductase